MAIAFVQKTAFNGTQQAFASLQTAGNTNFITTQSFNTGSPPTAVTDSVNGSYTLIKSSPGTSCNVSLWAKANIASASAGANTITTTYAAGATSTDSIGYEYSGLGNTLSVDVGPNAGAGNSTIASSTSITTTNAVDLIISAAIFANNQTITAGTNFTIRNTATLGMTLEDWITAATQTTTGPINNTGSGIWAALLIAYKGGGSSSNVAVAGNVNITGTQTAQLAVIPAPITGSWGITGQVFIQGVTPPGPTPSTPGSLLGLLIALGYIK